MKQNKTFLYTIRGLRESAVTIRGCLRSPIIGVKVLHLWSRQWKQKLTNRYHEN